MKYRCYSIRLQPFDRFNYLWS